MAEKVIWNKRALHDLRNIIEYLNSEWPEQVTQNFVTRLDDLIEVIIQYPEIGKIEIAERQIRGLVITKHNTLFYKLKPGVVILLRLFDNRQHPKKKAL